MNTMIITLFFVWIELIILVIIGRGKIKGGRFI